MDRLQCSAWGIWRGMWDASRWGIGSSAYTGNEFVEYISVLPSSFSYVELYDMSEGRNGAASCQLIEVCIFALLATLMKFSDWDRKA